MNMYWRCFRLGWCCLYALVKLVSTFPRHASVVYESDGAVTACVEFLVISTHCRYLLRFLSSFHVVSFLHFSLPFSFIYHVFHSVLYLSFCCLRLPVTAFLLTQGPLYLWTQVPASHKTRWWRQKVHSCRWLCSVPRQSTELLKLQDEISRLHRPPPVQDNVLRGPKHNHIWSSWYEMRQQHLGWNHRWNFLRSCCPGYVGHVIFLDMNLVHH